MALRNNKIQFEQHAKLTGEIKLNIDILFIVSVGASNNPEQHIMLLLPWLFILFIPLIGLVLRTTGLSGALITTGLEGILELTGSFKPSGPSSPLGDTLVEGASSSLWITGLSESLRGAANTCPSYALWTAGPKATLWLTGMVGTHSPSSPLVDTAVTGASCSLQSTGPPGTFSGVANPDPLASLWTIVPNGGPLWWTCTTGSTRASGSSSPLADTEVTGVSASLRSTGPPRALPVVANTGPSTSLSTAGPSRLPLMVIKRGPSGSPRTVARCLLAAFFPVETFLIPVTLGSVPLPVKLIVHYETMACAVMPCNVPEHMLFSFHNFILLIQNKGYRKYCLIMCHLHRTWRIFWAAWTNHGSRRPPFFTFSKHDQTFRDFSVIILMNINETASLKYKMSHWFWCIYDKQKRWSIINTYELWGLFHNADNTN